MRNAQAGKDVCARLDRRQRVGRGPDDARGRPSTWSSSASHSEVFLKVPW